jgi:hypothetical protein
MNGCIMQERNAMKKPEYNEGLKARESSCCIALGVEQAFMPAVNCHPFPALAAEVSRAGHNCAACRASKISSGSGLFRQSASTLAHKILPSGCATYVAANGSSQLWSPL